MKSIKNEVVSELVINKSEFINHLFPVSSVDDVNNKLMSIRKKFNDANHHCYAYIIGNNQEIQKFSDDGEPSRTAGMPMMDVLKKHDLTNVLTVSTRYFGGIKLGAGGLVRAYTKSVSEAINKADFSYLVKFNKLKIAVNFDHIGHIEKYIRDNFNLIDTIYSNRVEYYIEVESSDLEIFMNTISENTKGAAIIEIISEYEVYK